MKFKLFVILLLFVVSSFSTSGDEPVYYTSYESNNGVLCHGLHVGDLYYYNQLSGGETLYENGTLESWSRDPVIISIKLMEVPNDLTTSATHFYTYNQTIEGGDLTIINKRFLNSPGFENYFVYTDWIAWRNVFNNRTQAHIINNNLETYPIYYENSLQKDATFILTLYSNVNGHTNTESFVYNQTDGSLISHNYIIRVPFGGEIRSWVSWQDVRLVSKHKISEDNVCPDPINETTNTDDSPVFNFVYLVILIPIIRIKKFNKKLD